MSSKANHQFDLTNETWAFSSDDEVGVPYQSHSTPLTPRHRNKGLRQNSKLSRSLNNRSHNSTTVSLADFERNYLPLSGKKQPTSKIRSERSYLKSTNRLLQVLTGFKRWMEGASSWKIAIVGCLLGLLCAVVYQGGLHLGPLKRGERVTIVHLGMSHDVCEFVEWIIACTVNREIFICKYFKFPRNLI